MTIRKATLVGGVIAAVLCVGLQAAPVLAATPHAGPEVSAVALELPVDAATQAVHEANVAKFIETHPKPAVLGDTAKADEAAQNRGAWFAYLKTVPWTDVFGQWGCTVSNVSVVMSIAGDGNSYPTVQDVANCGGMQALTGIAGSLDLKSRVLAQPENAGLRSTLNAANTSNGVATPLAVSSHCSNVSATYLCILWDYSNGMIGASAQWEGSSSTYGHVRLGNTTGQACGLGSFVANGPDTTLNPGSINQALVYGVYQNGNWSSRFYNPNFYSGYCANNV